MRPIEGLDELVLGAIERLGPVVSMRQIMSELGVSRSSAQRAVRRLVSARRVVRSSALGCTPAYQVLR